MQTTEKPPQKDIKENETITSEYARLIVRSVRFVAPLLEPLASQQPGLGISQGSFEKYSVAVKTLQK